MNFIIFGLFCPSIYYKEKKKRKKKKPHSQILQLTCTITHFYYSVINHPLKFLFHAVHLNRGETTGSFSYLYYCSTNFKSLLVKYFASPRLSAPGSPSTVALRTTGVRYLLSTANLTESIDM